MIGRYQRSELMSGVSYAVMVGAGPPSTSFSGSYEDVMVRPRRSPAFAGACLAHHDGERTVPMGHRIPAGLSDDRSRPISSPSRRLWRTDELRGWPPFADLRTYRRYQPRAAGVSDRHPLACSACGFLTGAHRPACADQARNAVNRMAPAATNAPMRTPPTPNAAC